jgi:RNA polymerase sigma-70 factor (ECF subfamily)
LAAVTRSMENYNQYSDQDLIGLYKENHDLEVIGELFKRSQHIVLGVCLKYLKDVSSAEDALMDIFEELITALRTAEVRDFRPWLGTVTRNFLHRRYRKESKVRTLSFEEDLQKNEDGFVEFMDEDTPYDEHQRIEQQEDALRNAITQLKDEHKECITLFYLEKKSYTETCQITGYTFKQVKSYIQNGKRNIKNILGGQANIDI